MSSKHVDMGCNTDESMSNFAKEDCKTESSPSESLTGTAPEDDVVEVEDEDFEYPEKDNVSHVFNFGGFILLILIQFTLE